MQVRLLTLALINGAIWNAAPVLGMVDDPPTGTPQTSNMNASMTFYSADKLRGTSVKNTAGDSLGSITDLIIERGSGRIAYMILKSGATLGIGGKHVVVPYSAFDWDSVEKHAVLNSTPEQVKTWPEFEADRWSTRDREQNTLSRSLSSQYFRDTADASQLQTRKGEDDVRLRGTITRITRQTVPGQPETMLITLKTDDNNVQQVLVGPSWYFIGSALPVYRDTPIEIRAVRTDRAGQPLIARSMTMNSRETWLYDDRGFAMWSDGRADSSKRGAIVTPFVLATEIDGKTVQCRGEKCGSVDDLVVECSSGRIAFLSVDPDRNLFGIGDTKRLVPWQIVMATTNDAIMLDASKSMITSAPKTPSDLGTLANGNAYRDAYPGFDVSAPSFDSARK